MPVDMKESIAQAAKRLAAQKRAKKLTVKELVEECGITRQAFYYHFEDIPDLFRWILERDLARTAQEARALEGDEARLRYLFVLAINALPYVKRGMASGYRDELERILSQHLLQLFRQMCDEEGLYPRCTRAETDLILRYHCQAILGLLRNWTEADTKNLDQIVHTICRLMAGDLSPREG